MHGFIHGAELPNTSPTESRAKVQPCGAHSQQAFAVGWQSDVEPQVRPARQLSCLTFMLEN